MLGNYEVRTYASEALWLAARDVLMGGSSISKVIGLEPGAWSVWAHKLGLVPPEPPNEFMVHGKGLEDYILRLYAERACGPGERLVVTRWTSYVSTDCPWAGMSPDAVVIEEATGKLLRGVDAKNVSTWAKGWGDPYTDEVPRRVWGQCQWYAHISGAVRWDVAAFVGGNEFRVYYVHRDAEVGAQMERLAGEWYQRHVVDRIEPPRNLDDAAQASSVMSRRYPRSIDVAVQARAHDLQRVARIVVVQQAIKALESIADALTADLKLAMGDAAALQVAEGVPLATWKSAKGTVKVDQDLVAASMRAKLVGLMGREAAEAWLGEVTRDATTITDGSRRFLVKPRDLDAVGRLCDAALGAGAGLLAEGDADLVADLRRRIADGPQVVALPEGVTVPVSI